MTPPATPNLYKHHRFPGEIISHAVWLYFRFPLSHRDVEEILFVRGIIVSYEAIRKWCRKFGQQYANQLRRRRPRPGDKWHLDEVFITINKERHYLWRAVDQDGVVLDILVQRRRNKQAAKKFFRKLLKGCQYVPRVVITDKLKSYGRPSGRSCRAWSIASIGISITARRTRINPHGSASAGCKGLSPQATRNGFCRRMVPLLNTFDRAGIVGLRPHTGKKCSKDAKSGARSRVW